MADARGTAIVGALFFLSCHPGQVPERSGRKAATPAQEITTEKLSPTAPVPIYKPDPPFTKEARKEGFSGAGVFLIKVNENGNVVGVKPLKDLPFGMDESARKTLLTWRFKPATRHGKPVPIEVFVEIPFREW